MTPTDLETLLSSNVDTSKTNLETLLSALIGSNVGVMKTLAIIDSSLRTLKDDMATTKEESKNLTQRLTQLENLLATNQKETLAALTNTENQISENITTTHKQLGEGITNTEKQLDKFLEQLASVDDSDDSNTIEELLPLITTLSENVGVLAKKIATTEKIVTELNDSTMTFSSRIAAMDVKLASSATKDTDISLESLQDQVDEMNKWSQKLTHR